MTHPEPNIIALETSGRQGSVALARGKTLLAERPFSHNLRHAADLVPTVATMCREAGWKPTEIDQIYISGGPGSFTGLRIAISVARAMSQAVGCKLVAVPTVDVLAMNCPAEVGVLAVILDAKRGQVFGASYKRGTPADLPNGLVRMFGPALIEPAELIKSAGIGGNAVAVLGEGIDYHREALAGGAMELSKELWPARAGALHQIGWEKACRGEFTVFNELLPTYIRLAEAEEVWRKKHGLPLH